MKLPLFAFPYAGGAAHVFGDIAGELRHAELVALEYPGRGRRISEPCKTSLSEVVEDVLDRNARLFQRAPYALLGHSMGAHVVALLGRRLVEERIRLPLVAVVTGARAPTHREPDGDHTLPDPEFIEKLREMGGFDPVALASPELMELFLPILRADFEACEEYPWPLGPALSFPIVAACGDSDDDVRGESFDAWAEISSEGCELHTLPGDHFFAFEESRSRVVQLIDEAARRHSKR